jgi:hypothetical protein
LSIVSLKLPSQIIRCLQDSFHVLLSNLFAVEEFSLSTVTLVLHPLESFLEAHIFPRKEILVLGKDIDFSAEALSSPLDLGFDVSGFLELLFKNRATGFKRAVLDF